MEQIRRLYKVVTEVNRAIIREKDRESLFKEICNIAVGDGGFLLAWVGNVIDNSIMISSYAGQGKHYIEQLKVDLSDSLHQTGPINRSVRDKKICCINDIATEKANDSWGNSAVNEGFKSAASVPLYLEKKVIAVFVLYSNQINVFDEKMQQLLNYLSDDLSFALNHFEINMQNSQSEKRLLVLSSAIDQSADAVTIINREKRIEYVNPKFTELTGFDASDVIGTHPSLFCFNEDESTRFTKILDAVFSGRKWRGEFRKKKSQGRNVLVYGYAKPH
jgi:PAS domain S-box-containing protein